MAKYVKGLNKDTAPVDQPEGSYRYAKNALSNETAGAISNEPGTSKAFSLRSDGHILGTIEITDDRVILFEVDGDNDSRIYSYNPVSDSLSIVLQTSAGNAPAGNDFDLKFNRDYPIEGTYKINPEGDLIVYWTDNFNPPRSLNVTRQLTSSILQIYGVNPFASPNTNYVDRLNLFPHAGPVPKIEFSNVANGGALKSGVYYLFLAYVDADFTQTNYVSYSLGVPIVEDDESVSPIERYDGCENDTQTGKSIVWTASNLNTDYEFLRPIVVHRSGEEKEADTEFAYTLNDIDIDPATGVATVVFSGLEGYKEAAVEEAIVDTVAYDTAKTLTQLDSILYLGNLSGTKDVGYQKYANFIKLECVSDKLRPFDTFEISADNLDYGYLETEPDPDITKEEGFRSMRRLSSTVFNRRGYARDEVYAFYIAFVLNDGSMSYAYHIPGRKAYEIDSDDAGTVRKVDQDPSTGVSFLANFPDFTEKEDLNDPDLIALTQGQGKLFHFYDFSIFGTRNTNFWENKNEFYPNTNDYDVVDASTETITETLKGLNVRHHHMPCNTNSGMEMVSNNTDSFTAATETQTITYFFTVGQLSSSGEGCVQNGPNGGNADSLTMMTGEFGSTNPITSDTNAGYNNGLDNLENWWGSASTWEYKIPTPENFIDGSNPITNGHFLWFNGTAIGQATGSNGGGSVNGYVGDPNEEGGGVDINQGGTQTYGYGTVTSGPGQINGAMFVWRETIAAVGQDGVVSQEVQALGIKLEDIKIPKSIADKVQGFRIYYAERKHENRRILGQDFIKSAPNLNTRDLSACNEGGNNSEEDLILAAGALYGGEIHTATFHDFYLLNRRNSLIPATHTSLEYKVDMLSFRGPGHLYTEGAGDCLEEASRVSFHIGRTYNNFTSNNQPFVHFPIREKCKTYVNGDSIYDGRGVGFGKRIYNLGGESSVMLAYNPSRRPKQLAFDDPGDDVSWNVLPSVGQGFSYQTPAANKQVRLQLHTLNAFKTDMYLSYDTQELIWTGYEVLGKDLKRFVLDEEGNSPALANRHTTDDIYGGDTFICRHGYRITHRPEYVGAAPTDVKSVIYGICESSDNINFRHETDINTTYFPGSPARKLLEKKAELDFTKKDNMKYSGHYSLGVADIKPAMPFPLREAQPSTFETRVIRSAKEDNTSIIDNYRVYLAFQLLDLPRDRGSLWKLISLSNLLYLHTEDSLFRTKGKQSMKLSDGSESFVGSGDIFTQEPDEVIQTKFGYGGTQSQWVSMVTKHGYFCLDYRNRRVFMFKDALYDIGKTGLETWFQDNIPYTLEKYGLPATVDNPIIGIGFLSMYDERYDRILLTKRDLKPTQEFITLWDAGQEVQQIGNFNTTVVWRDELNRFAIQIQNHPAIGGFKYTPIEFNDTKYFTPTGWTVSYDVELNVWVSFHDYVPYKYSRSRDILASFDDTLPSREMSLHNAESARGRFYGTDYPFEFEFIYNTAKDQDKVFYSFNYMIDVSNTSGALLHDQGFSSFYVYTTHQNSDEQEIEYMINTRRIGNEWKINKFRDMAALVNTPLAAAAGSNFGVVGASVAGTNLTSVETTTTNTMFNIDGMSETINNSFINAAKVWNKQRKFSDKWVGIRLKYSNSTKKLINLYSTDVAAKKFYR